MAAGGRTERAEAVFQQVKRLVEGGLGSPLAPARNQAMKAPWSALTAAAAATCGCRSV
jgi:hypothetical protein